MAFLTKLYTCKFISWPRIGLQFVISFATVTSFTLHIASWYASTTFNGETTRALYSQLFSPRSLRMRLSKKTDKRFREFVSCRVTWSHVYEIRFGTAKKSIYPYGFSKLAAFKECTKGDRERDFGSEAFPWAEAKLESRRTGGVTAMSAKGRL